MKNANGKVKVGYGKGNKATEDVVRKLLASIGDCSYGFFYVHILVLTVVMKLVSFTAALQVWGLYFSICFAMTAMISYMLVWVIRKITEWVQGEGFLKIIGF